jgi:hypothetical protein
VRERERESEGERLQRYLWEDQLVGLKFLLEEDIVGFLQRLFHHLLALNLKLMSFLGLSFGDQQYPVPNT